MFHGVHGEYRWLETSAHEIYDVLQVCPAVAANKHIVITSFDSGPLQPTAEEFERGWRVHGRSMHIPVGDSVSAIPFEIFDEWYIFPSEPAQADYRVFVNYEWFTLGPAQAVFARSGSAFDLKRMQRWFWQEIERFAPETYLACGNRLKFVTREPELFHRVLRGLSELGRLRGRTVKAPA
jgi:hypothetical protein